MMTTKPFAPGLYAGGQPTAADLDAFAGIGVRTVVNLRAASEAVDYDEAAHAQRLGLRYVALPVAGPEDVTRDTVARFSRILDDARAHGATLIHCASSNRVGALVALDAGLARGMDRDQAIALGRCAGMATLEPLVTAMLDAASTQTGRRL